MPYRKYAAVLQLNRGVARLVRDRDRVAPSQVVVLAHCGEAAGLEPEVDDFTQSDAGMHALGRQIIHLDVAFVANDQALCAIKEA